MRDFVSDLYDYNYNGAQQENSEEESDDDEEINRKLKGEENATNELLSLLLYSISVERVV